MTVTIFDCAQRSEDWFRARAGIPTASEFSTLLAKGRDGGDSKTRRTYMLKLAGEIITGEPMESYDNAHMERGRIMEEEARDLYAFLADDPLSQVGFLRDDDKRAGCSPDSLVGNDGMVEIKTALPHILIGHILKGDFPADHKAQCQGALWIAGREWIDICVYWPKMTPFIKRAYREDIYLRDLEKAVRQFNEELDETVERVRRYGAPSTLRSDLEASLVPT